MTAPRKNITYRNSKDGMEISGEPNDVKQPILIDQIAKELRWLVPIVILLFIMPKASLIPLLLKWTKSRLTFLTLFVVAATYAQLLLSG